MRQRWILAIGVCGAIAACKRNKLEKDYTPAARDAAEAVAVGALHTKIVDGVSGTAFFAPDARSFWVQNNDGDAMVQIGLDGATLATVPLDGPLEEASLWIRTAVVARPVSPDGTRLLEERTESEDEHTNFVLDLVKRTETALPVGEYSTVNWLADGRLLVLDLHGFDDPIVAAILDPVSLERTPVCAQPGVTDLDVNLDGATLLVATKSGVDVTDLACKKLAPVLAAPGPFPSGSPHRTAWIASELRDGGDLGLRTVAPKARDLGVINPPWTAWLDDDRFVFMRDGVALWARASDDAAPAPVAPPPRGCHDETVSGAPQGGVVVIGRGCGEGLGAMVIVTP